MAVTRLRDVPAEISAMRDFDGASMRGRAYGPRSASYVDPGWLHGSDHEQFLKDRPKIIYIVFSYATPIAWVTRGRDPHIVEQQFSMTTSSKHMPQVLTAWGEWVPEGHRLATQARRRRSGGVGSSIERVARGQDPRTQRYTVYRPTPDGETPISTEGTLRVSPVTYMANPSHIVPGGEYPWDAIKRENAEREAELSLTDRIEALIGE